IGGSSRISVHVGTITNSGPSGSLSVYSTWSAVIGQCGQEEQITVTLPVAAVQQLANGYARGLFVWSDSTSDYGAFYGYGDANPPRLSVAYYT
ncbi:MAG: hypothetical protein Q4A66_02365, partial [Eubacteriales bacterium]|nr:hypothetical protein [Eubacteriales bacterium]